MDPMDVYGMILSNAGRCWKNEAAANTSAETELYQYDHLNRRGALPGNVFTHQLGSNQTKLKPLEVMCNSMCRIYMNLY